MRRGKKVIVHGDGSSIWTLTHQEDFAKGLVGLLGHSGAIGQAVNITSDEWLTWDQIHHLLARAAGTRADIVHVPSEVIARHDAEWGAGLLGDKTHSMIFDNSKLKRLVPDYAAVIPFSRGAEEIMAYHDADPARRTVDPQLDATMDTLVAVAERAYAGPRT
jgi:nucleoside-diphosphate-sugar epimerase